MEIHLKSRTVKYVSVTVAFLLVTTFLLYLFNMDKSIESLSEINYFDLLLGQIANTLIVLSLTSVLSSNFGQAYWVDIKETKLIKPFWTCFTGITVYLLTALFYSILMYAMGRYAGVLLSAVFSTVLLIILSFQMISIYFGKEGIKQQLREEYEQLLRLTNYPYVSDYLYKIKKLEKELEECASPEKEELGRALQTEIRELEQKLNSGDEKLVDEAHKEYIERSVDAHENLKSIDIKLEEYTKNAIKNNDSDVIIENIELLVSAENDITLFRLMEDLFSWDERYCCKVLRQVNERGTNFIINREMHFFKQFALQKLIEGSGKLSAIQFLLSIYDQSNLGMKNIREDLKKIDSERRKLRDKELELNKVMLSHEDIGEGYRQVKQENKQLEEEKKALEKEILALLSSCTTKDLRSYYLPLEECYRAYEEGKYEIANKYITVILECFRLDFDSIRFDTGIMDIHSDRAIIFSYFTKEELWIVERLIEEDKLKSVLSEENKKALLSMKEIKL